MTITLAHGAGGRLSQQLVQDHFLPRLRNPALEELTDAASVGDLAVTTDGYVVSPRFFPGGDLGQLAVCGTLNDLVMSGAVPIALTVGLILEEGLSLAELDQLVDSMAAVARDAGVPIAAGDTKVVPRGSADGAFITTAGVGRLSADFHPRPNRVRAGDAVLVSGSLGDHGMAVMACREGLPLEGELRSDVAYVGGLVDALRAAGVEVHALRDPTRGGAAQSLIEIAAAAGVRVVIAEDSLPIRPAVRSACELLGLDPLYVANEGKLICFVPADQADLALSTLRGSALGAAAATIGRVEPGRPGLELATTLGARRSVRMPQGELLPRIC